MECHLSGFSNDASITVQAGNAAECCELGGRSFNDGSGCVTACGVIGEYITNRIRDWACEYGTCGHIRFAYFFKFP